jgi:hypothetical protein
MSEVMVTFQLKVRYDKVAVVPSRLDCWRSGTRHGRLKIKLEA